MEVEDSPGVALLVVYPYQLPILGLLDNVVLLQLSRVERQ
jgi:hypothetical protein